MTKKGEALPSGTGEEASWQTMYSNDYRKSQWVEWVEDRLLDLAGTSRDIIDLPDWQERILDSWLACRRKPVEKIWYERVGGFFEHMRVNMLPIHQFMNWQDKRDLLRHIVDFDFAVPDTSDPIQGIFKTHGKHFSEFRDELKQIYQVHNLTLPDWIDQALPFWEVDKEGALFMLVPESNVKTYYEKGATFEKFGDAAFAFIPNEVEKEVASLLAQNQKILAWRLKLETVMDVRRSIKRLVEDLQIPSYEHFKRKIRKLVFDRLQTITQDGGKCFVIYDKTITNIAETVKRETYEVRQLSPTQPFLVFTQIEYINREQAEGKYKEPNQVLVTKSKTGEFMLGWLADDGIVWWNGKGTDNGVSQEQKKAFAQVAAFLEGIIPVSTDYFMLNTDRRPVDRVYEVSDFRLSLDDLFDINRPEDPFGKYSIDIVNPTADYLY
ncbi:hypothetical protein C4579_03150 [Candidatus Microgenomates bacterium]|nr:MAG: hypothetical protein C4579_03150 [Candidatus Microgenomates bacterium]